MCSCPSENSKAKPKSFASLTAGRKIQNQKPPNRFSDITWLDWRIVTLLSGFGEAMKLWFPNWIQWIVMWVGLVALSLALTNALGYRNEGWGLVVFVLGAVLFLLWMLE